MQDRYRVKRAGGHPIEVSVPGSKSITCRALLIAALADGRSILRGVLFSDDSRHFLRALCDLGFEVNADEENETVEITGCGGKIPGVKLNQDLIPSVNVGSAGTAARFLAAFLGLSEGRFRMDSSEQMKKRPMRELLASLESLGARCEWEGEPYHFPFVIGCDRIKNHEVTVDVDRSSQFLSALLISSVLFDEDFTIHVTGSHGMAYVDMTVDMMLQFGADVQRPDLRTFIIPGGAKYQPMEYEIEPDASAAAYFYAMSPVLGVNAKVRNVHRNFMQGDICFLDVLEQMGCAVREDEDGITVLPPANGILTGGVFNLSGFSDQALTLAAISCFTEIGVTIMGIGHIRQQECDRIAAISENLGRLGIRCEAGDDWVHIFPGKPHGCTIKTFDDHRVAMSFAIPGLVTDGVIIENPGCCGKTFENYFDVIEKDVL